MSIAPVSASGCAVLTSTKSLPDVAIVPTNVLAIVPATARYQVSRQEKPAPAEYSPVTERRCGDVEARREDIRLTYHRVTEGIQIQRLLLSHLGVSSTDLGYAR